MFQILSIFFFIFIIISLIITIWILFIFIKNFKKNYNIYRSVFKSLFKNISSILIIIIFYGVTFGLVGGGNISNYRASKVTNQQIVENKAHQGDFIYFGIKEYNNYLFDEMVQFYDQDYIYQGTINDEESFIIALDTFVADEYGIEDFWENYGLTYFPNISSFVVIVIVQNLFQEFNQNPTDLPYIEGEPTFKIVYNIYPNDLYKPRITGNQKELYYFMGFNSPGYNNFSNNDQFNQENSLRYAGDDDDYIIDDYQIVDSNGKSKDEINQILASNNPEVYGDGSRDNPYQVVIQNDYAVANNLDVGDSFNIDNVNYQIIATAAFPNVIYPLYNSTNFVADYENQGAILMNQNTYNAVSDQKATYTITYGYTDIYDSLEDFTQYVVSYDQPSVLKERLDKMNKIISKESSDNIGLGQEGLITNESYSKEARRTNVIMFQIQSGQAMINIFNLFFLIIVLIVLVLLIKKRVQDYSKEFGTLKALGLNRNQIAASFLVYPFFIILFGGILAFIVAFPVQFLFFAQMTKFYSLPTIGYAINFNFFYLVFFMPLIILIAVSFITSYIILNKPTIDLLSNKVNDDTNVITRKTEALIPNSASFETSYKIKGFTRALGTSMILFISICLASTLTALGLSGITTITDLKEQQNNSYNFNYYNSLDNNANYQIKDSSENDYNDLTPLYGDYDTLVPFNYLSFVYQELDSNLKSDANWEVYYQKIGDVVLSEVDREVVNKNGQDEAYLPKEAIVNYIIAINIVKNLAGDNWDPNIFWTLPDGTTSEYSASTLEPFINIFITNAFNKYFYLNDKERSYSFENLEEDIFNDQINLESEYNSFLSNYQDYTSDVVFGNLYYDPTEQSLVSLNNYIVTAHNTDTDWPNAHTKYMYITIFDQASNINNVVNVGQDSSDQLQKEEDKIDNNEDIDYLPVILDQTTYDFLVESSDAKYDPNSDVWTLNYYDNYDDKHNQINLKIVDVYDSTSNFGFITTAKLFEYYQLNVFGHQDFSLNYNSVFWNESTGFKNNYTLTINEDDYGKNLNFGYFLNNPNNLEGYIFSKDLVASQKDVIFHVFQEYFIIFAVFSLFTGLVLVVIAMKEVNDKSKREISLLKAFGYSNTKATILILTPFIIVILLGFLISIPIAIMILFLLARVLGQNAEVGLSFKVGILGWTIIITFLLIMVIALLIWSYFYFRKTNPLEVILQTD